MFSTINNLSAKILHAGASPVFLATSGLTATLFSTSSIYLGKHVFLSTPQSDNAQWNSTKKIAGYALFVLGVVGSIFSALFNGLAFGAIANRFHPVAGIIVGSAALVATLLPPALVLKKSMDAIKENFPLTSALEDAAALENAEEQKAENSSNEIEAPVAVVAEEVPVVIVEVPVAEEEASVALINLPGRGLVELSVPAVIEVEVPAEVEGEEEVSAEEEVEAELAVAAPLNEETAELSNTDATSSS